MDNLAVDLLDVYIILTLYQSTSENLHVCGLVPSHRGSLDRSLHFIEEEGQA